MNVHNTDKQGRVIEAMELLIRNGANERIIIERVSGRASGRGNALTKANELNAERETRGMFTEVIDYLKNLGLKDPQEDAVERKNIFTGV